VAVFLRKGRKMANQATDKAMAERDWQARLKDLCLSIPIEVNVSTVTRTASEFLKMRASPMAETACRRCGKIFWFPRFPRRGRAYCDECKAKAKRPRPRRRKGDSLAGSLPKGYGG
jgi:hypothetical protein